MATLTGKKISDTYKDLLQVSNSNSGIDSTLRTVSDGEATDSVLQISSAAVNITGAGTLQYGGTAISATAAELNILDGVTTTAAELNVLDGITAGTVSASLGVVVDSNKDIGTFRNITLSGELDAGSLDVSGNADIDGTLEADAITVNGTTLNDVIDGRISSGTVGTATVATNVTASANNSTDETVYPTFVDGATGTQGIETDTGFTYNPSSGLLTITGELDAGSLDISGNADIDGTLEADAITVDGTALATYIRDTVGTNMLSSNTESGITVTYDTSNDNIDFSIDAAQTGITSLLATDIKIGEDDETKIDFETADTINFYAGNEKQLILTDGALTPGADNILDLGSSGVEFKDAYFDGTVTSDAFAGPLTGDVTGNVSGTAATVTGAAQTNITSLGTLTALTVDNVSINGSTIGHTGDTDLMTVASGVLTVAGEVDATSLDISGDADIDGTLEADAITVGGTALSSVIAGTTVTSATNAAHVNVADNESTDENDLIPFIENASATGNVGLESDGDFHYNPSSGTVTATIFKGNIDAVDGDFDGTLEADAITVGGTALSSVIQGTTVSNATLAATVTVTDSSADSNYPVVFHDNSNALLDDTGALYFNPSTGTLRVPNLNVAGTTTTVDTVTMEAANAIVFEGASPDDWETTLSIVDPTADRTQYLLNLGGYVPLLAADTTTQISATPAELNVLDGVTAGTVSASLGVVVDSNKDIGSFRNITLTGELDAGSLDVSGNADIDGTLETDAFSINGTLVSSTANELNVLDGITAVVGELNALDLGSTAVGTAIASKAVVLDSNKDYTGIRNFTITGELDAATLDISGDADIDGTLEADAYTVNGDTLAEYISDTVGAMVSSNTETAMTVTYQDGDNTLDFALSHLGLENLADPDADKILYWDDSAGTLAWGEPNEGLAVSGSNINFDGNSLTDMTETMVTGDEFVVLDGTSSRKKEASEIGLSIFNNDAGFSTGDITGVTIQTDTGSGSKATDNAGSADFILQGGTGVGVTNSSATITVALSHLGIESLSDPNADRILMWDDSAGAVAWATANTGLTISGTNINNTVSDTDTTYSAGDLIDFDGTQIDVDLSEASEAAIADGDYVLFLDGGATGTQKKEALADMVTLMAGGNGLVASSSVMSVNASDGIAVSGDGVALSHLGLEALSDPNADRILFWDDSAGALKWLTANSNIAISGTDLNATDSDTNTTYSAGNGMALSSTTFSVAGNTGLSQDSDGLSLSHLGLESLSDPDADRILFWDDSASALKWLEPNESIAISGTSLNADNDNTTYSAGNGIGLSSTTFSVSAGTGLTQNSAGLGLSHLGIESLTDPNADRILIWDDSAGAVAWGTANTGLSISGTNINNTETDTNTTYSAGTNISLSSTTFNVDDAFLINSGNDTTSGTITAAGFTTTGNLSLAGHAVNDIDIGSEFTDADDTLMTSGAIKEKIESYGYATQTGDITGVTAGDALSGGGTSGSVTLNLNHLGIEDLTDPNADRILIWDDSAGAVKWGTANTGLSISGTNINNTVSDTDTTYSAGTNISLSSTTFNVDDAFLINDGNDTTSGTITAGGFTTLGSISLAGHTFDDIDIGSEFVDSDAHIMSSGAIKEKIEDYGYTTNTGDITAVTAGTNCSGGGSSGSVTINVDDAFLINSGNDTTSGTITAAGFTTAGSITLGGHSFNDIDIGSEFVDTDDHLMSSGAIKEKIEAYGYTTNTGDMTGVDLTGANGIAITSESNTGSGAYSATINLSHLGIEDLSDPNADRILIWDDSAGAVAWGTANTGLSISGTNINNTVSDTNTTYSAGTNISLSSTTFNVDDAFLKNDANDTTSGTITAAGFNTESGKVGDVSDEYIDFGTAGEIQFKIDDVEDFMMADGGTFHANADVIAYSSSISSDKRLKKNIKDVSYGLEDVLKLRGVEFDWKEKLDGKHDIGFIAQEIEEVVPELVKEVDGLNNEDPHLVVDYAKLVPVLVESIKELKEEVDLLNANLADMKYNRR